MKRLSTLLGSHVCEKKTCLRALLGKGCSALQYSMGGLLPCPTPISLKKKLFCIWKSHQFSAGPVPCLATSHVTGSIVEKASLSVHITIPHQSGTFLTADVQVGRLWMCTGGGCLGNLSTVFSTLLPPSPTNLNNAGPMTHQCRSPASGR